MQYTYSEIEFAMCATRVLAIVLLVGFFSYLAKSRAMFVVGTLGSFLGYVIPEPRVFMSGTAEGLFLGHLQWTASHVAWWGFFGACTGCLTVAGMRTRRHWPRLQFSPKTLLLTLTAIAIVAAIVRFALN